MIYPNGIIAYKMYVTGEGTAKELPGVTKVTMPEIKYKTVETRGAGIMGSFTTPLSGMIDPMTVDMEFSSHDALVALGGNRWYNVSLYESDQHFDGTSISEELRSLRFDLTLRPTSTGIGDVAPFAERNAKASFSVIKYAVYVDDKEVVYIDPVNFINRVNGVDTTEKVRRALGMD